MKKTYLLLIFLCYLIFFVATPPFQLPDEPDHFQYVYWLSKGVYPRLPDRGGYMVYDKTIQKVYDMLQVASNDYNISNFAKIGRASRSYTPFATGKDTPPHTYQSHHPPLYHLSALLFFIPSFFLSKGNLITTYYATKPISLLYYAAAIYLVWQIGFLLTRNKKTANYLMLVFALNPVTVKMAITINPDIASLALSMGILYVFLRIRNRKNYSMKSLIGIGVLLAVGTLIKFQNIVYVFFAAGFFLLQGIRGGDWKRGLRNAVAVALFAVIPVIPWLLFSLVTYHAITPSYVAFQYFCTPNLAPIPWYRLPFEILFEFRHAFFHFAGFLGWGEPYPFKAYFLLYAGLFVALLTIGIAVLLRKREWKWNIVLAHSAMICLFFLGVSITYKVNRYSCDIQGRYLLSSFYPFVLYAWVGLTALVAKRSEKVARWMMIVSVWQYIFILCYVLLPRYFI